MKKKLLALCLGLLVVGMVSASAQKESKGDMSGDFAFGGSTTVDPIITAAIEEWKDMYPQVHISYEGVGSSAGVKGILAGTYSLGAASRELKDAETASGAKSTAIALDALAAIVNKNSVTIANLTVEQLAKIFAGKITNWSEVGGPDAEIVVFNRDEASGTYETFEVKVMGDNEFMKNATVVASNGDMAAKVGSTPYAIGYVGLGFTKEQGVKPISLGGVAPSIANVYNGTYAVQRNLNVVFTGTLGKVEQAFVDYLLSKDGQEIVEDIGFIKLK